jgi:hypothetical protein
VGIGTDAPDGKLNVFSSSAGSVSADADADELVLENSGNVGLSLLTASTGESSIYFGNPGSDGQKDFSLKYYHESHPDTEKRRSFTFNSASQQLMCVNNNGRVGIGTAAPVRPLHVENDGLADLLLRDTSSYSVGTGPAVIFQGKDSGDTTTQFGAIYGISNGANSGEITFETRNSGSSAERMRIDSSGNMLLGPTAGPVTYRADIRGTSSGVFKGLRVFNGDDGAAAQTEIALCLNRVGSEVEGAAGIIRGGKEQTWTTAPSTVNSYMSFSTVRAENLNEAMRIDSSGNVLVGHTGSIYDVVTSTSGLSLTAAGELFASSSESSGPMILNRRGSDGLLSTFKKDGVTVGSIGTSATITYMMYYPSTGIRGGSSGIIPATTNGVAEDNTKDWGSASYRFRNGYFGGTVRGTRILADNLIQDGAPVVDSLQIIRAFMKLRDAVDDPDSSVEELREKLKVAVVDIIDQFQDQIDTMPVPEEPSTLPAPEELELGTMPTPESPSTLPAPERPKRRD